MMIDLNAFPYFCNQDYCVCNPETSLDQACPFELSTEIDCRPNATTAGDRLKMACVQDLYPNQEYFTKSTCLTDDDGYGITQLALVNQDGSKILWSCDDADGNACYEIPPCSFIVVSESSTLEPTMLTTPSSATTAFSSGTVMVLVLSTLFAMVFATRKQ